jgi:hypothetical protein
LTGKSAVRHVSGTSTPPVVVLVASVVLELVSVVVVLVASVVLVEVALTPVSVSLVVLVLVLVVDVSDVSDVPVISPDRQR